MKLKQSRSLLVRTSQNGNRRSHISYDNLPVSNQQIQKYKNQFMSTARTSFQGKLTNSIPQSAMKNQSEPNNMMKKFNQTQDLNSNQARGISHRIMSSEQRFRSTCKSSYLKNQHHELLQRPSTQFRGHHNFEVKTRMKLYSPLQIIKTKLTEDMQSIKLSRSHSRILTNSKRQCETSLTKWNTTTLLTQKKNFLKKGTAFDRTLLHNILKCKLKQKVTPSADSYSNAYSNNQIHSNIRKQIPNEFRDIIGPEEMLRMSRILSGVDLKTVDMNDRIQKAISSRMVKTKLKTLDSNADDNQTLRSIKRW